MIFIIVIHVIVCIVLIGLVLIQRGRGSGLVESFHGVESMFGTKTNTFLTRTTTVLSIIFFFTCLSLAVLSVRQSRSLMRNVVPDTAGKEVTQEAAKPQEKPAVTQQQAQQNQNTPALGQTQEPKGAPKLE